MTFTELCLVIFCANFLSIMLNSSPSDRLKINPKNTIFKFIKIYQLIKTAQLCSYLPQVVLVSRGSIVRQFSRLQFILWQSFFSLSNLRLPTASAELTWSEAFPSHLLGENVFVKDMNKWSF